MVHYLSTATALLCSPTTGEQCSDHHSWFNHPNTTRQEIKSQSSWLCSVLQSPLTLG